MNIKTIDQIKNKTTKSNLPKIQKKFKNKQFIFAIKYSKSCWKEILHQIQILKINFQPNLLNINIQYITFRLQVYVFNKIIY